jgi:hypothetical protein
MNELCKVCERVAFGPIVRLGFDNWRHEDCVLGSQEWKLYYHRQPLKSKMVLKEFYNLFKHVYEV